MNKLLDFLGLVFPVHKEGNIEYPNYKYVHESVTSHRNYLVTLLDFQRDRQSAIESKTSQLVGQSSIVFSLVALFIPLFFDKFIERDIITKVVIAILFLSAFVFYLFTIFHSTRNLSIDKFKYSTGKPETVLDKASNTEFLAEEINDWIYSVNVNSYANDQKGENLIYAQRTFSIGNILFAILSFVICITLFIPADSPSFEQKQLESIKENREVIQSISLELQRQTVNDSIYSERLIQFAKELNKLQMSIAGTLRKISAHDSLKKTSEFKKSKK